MTAADPKLGDGAGDDLVALLRRARPFGTDYEKQAADRIERDAATIAELNERLENNRVYDMAGHRIDKKPGSIPDGIDCRNETIKGQDAIIAALQARVEAAEKDAGRWRWINSQGGWIAHSDPAICERLIDECIAADALAKGAE